METATFSFIINGEQCGFIDLSRALRQGDLISPSLFLFCFETWSCLLIHVAVEGRISGHQVCTGALFVSHFLYDDDYLVFCKVTVKQA